MPYLILTPYLATERGNATSARRLAKGLAEAGIEVNVQGFNDGHFDIPHDTGVVHGFHAYHFGRKVLPLLPASIPVILTLTGTDYNCDLYDPERRPAVFAALERASIVTAFHEQAASQVAAEFPAVTAKLRIIPPGVSLEEDNGCASIPGLTDGQQIVLLVAGLRKVKNIFAAVSAVEKLYRSGYDIALVHVGPVLEEDVGQAVRLAGQQYPWFISLGEVPHSQMKALYQQASVVVNTSLSEAIPNSILEAMYCHRPVVVSDIPGNRAAVSHGETGLIYKDSEDFVQLLAAVLTNRALATELGQKAGSYVRGKYTLEQEIASYSRLYHELIG